MWEKVVLNLLSNAFKHTFTGDITVSLRAEAESAVLRVTDTGAGIAPEVQPRIFDPYFSTKKTGTGLGLPTVRRVVEEHGGALTFTSEVGKGTQFTMRLPGKIHA
jgi:signal transduction histidine kinase